MHSFQCHTLEEGNIEGPALLSEEAPTDLRPTLPWAGEIKEPLALHSTPIYSYCLLEKMTYF